MSSVFYHMLLFFVLLWVSIFIIREDLRSKRIPNKLIRAALVAGFFVHVLALMTGVITTVDFWKIVLNALIAFGVVWSIWQLGLWPAGDAKFFIVVSFLLPRTCYGRVPIDFFPSFSILFNVFCVYLSFLAMKALVWIGIAVITFVRSGNFEREKFKQYLQEGHRYFLFPARRKVLVNSIFKVLFKVLVMAMLSLLLSKGAVRPGFLFFCFLSVSAFGFLLRACLDSSSRKKIPWAEIRIGLNLSDDSIRQLKEDQGFFRSLGVLRAEGLMEDQPRQIRDFLQARKITTIEIYDTIAFSPFIFLGAVTTVMLGGAAFF